MRKSESGWNPAGDDDRGINGSDYIWLWNASEYDWKGRVERSIPSDSNGSDGKDTLISYAGCGCAGGMITTIQGPVTTAKDVGGTLQTTKVEYDMLGRVKKQSVPTEVASDFTPAGEDATRGYLWTHQKKKGTVSDLRNCDSANIH